MSGAPRKARHRGLPGWNKLGGSHLSPPPHAPKPDAVVGYMEHSNSVFEDQIVMPLRAIFGDIHGMRNYAVSSSDLQANHAPLVDMISKIDEEFWKVVHSTKRISRRFQGQVQKVKKQTTQRLCSSGNTAKSARRKVAGRLKAASLTSWRQECASAREALKKEGYKGSLKVKKRRSLNCRRQKSQVHLLLAEQVEVQQTSLVD